MNADPDSYEFQAHPLNLLTPLRTLRGHGEGITSLQLLASGTGALRVGGMDGHECCAGGLAWSMWVLAALTRDPLVS